MAATRVPPARQFTPASHTPIRAAIYARVSTVSEQDPTVQTRELEEYCARRGWRVVGTYIDIGISGTKEKRPQLDRLMVDAQRRRLDAVAVWRFDRMARSVSHLLRVLETFNALSIQFVSLSEQVDTGGTTLLQLDFDPTHPCSNQVVNPTGQPPPCGILPRFRNAALGRRGSRGGLLSPALPPYGFRLCGAEQELEVRGWR